MKTIFAAILMVLASLSTTAYATGTGTSVSDVALQLVEKYRFGENLRGMSYEVSARTETYGMIVAKVGEQKAKQRVHQEIDKLIPEYQPQWNRNLAQAYAHYMSVEKLQSIVDEGQRSQYSDEFRAKQNDIGALMQSKSTGLLNDLLTKAMTTALQSVAQ